MRNLPGEGSGSGVGGDHLEIARRPAWDELTRAVDLALEFGLRRLAPGSALVRVP